MRYFARTTAGLEEIAWLDIRSRLPDVELTYLAHRLLMFEYAEYPAQLLDLRSVDDVYVYVATVPGIAHTHASLDTLRRHMGQLQFGDALGVVQTVRSLGRPISFYVTASYLGSRNYSRHDIASLQDGHSILDPFCGAGTIGLEAAETQYQGRVLNGDVHEEAVRCAVTNCATADTLLVPGYWIADAGRTPLKSNTVARIVSNLPWGRQVKAERDLADLYRFALGEIERLLRPGGRAVLLTDQSELLLQHAGALQLVLAKQISLYGRYPTIHVLDKGATERTTPYAATSAFGQTLNRLIARDGRRQPYRPLRDKVP